MRAVRNSLAMNLSKPVTQLQEPPGAFILRFARFPLGASSAINHIPNCLAGIYVWYKLYNYPRDYEGFKSALFSDAAAPKFPERQGELKPYFNVKISSKGSISNTKQPQIIEALESDRFRGKLQRALDHLALFQAPLYIGKSRNIKTRIEQHLKTGSLLNMRLQEHQISMDDTALLVIPSEQENDDCSENEEDLYEEIFSRLLNPLFNLRLG
jgi:hypothetical protein